MSEMSRDTEDRLTVTEVEEFLRKPPAGFSMHFYGSGYFINSDAEKHVILIDDFHVHTGRIVFQNSLRRKVKMHNLGQYTSVRKCLLSKRIYLLSTAWEQTAANNDRGPLYNFFGGWSDVCFHGEMLTLYLECSTNGIIYLHGDKQLTPSYRSELKRFVVSIDGKDPYIKWQMERGLDWATASVAGESYRVDIDLTEALETWSSKALNLTNNSETISSKALVWREAFVTLKYYADAMFDFPFWFGFSKRKFKLKIT